MQWRERARIWAWMLIIWASRLRRGSPEQMTTLCDGSVHEAWARPKDSMITACWIGPGRGRSQLGVPLEHRGSSVRREVVWQC